MKKQKKYSQFKLWVIEMKITKENIFSKGKIRKVNPNYFTGPVVAREISKIKSPEHRIYHITFKKWGQNQATPSSRRPNPDSDKGVRKFSILYQNRRRSFKV